MCLLILTLLAKLVPVAYGIQKLQINCVVEDEKIGTDFLEEEITKFEDYVSILLYEQLSTCLLYTHKVQSVDIAAFNKL